MFPSHAKWCPTASIGYGLGHMGPLFMDTIVANIRIQLFISTYYVPIMQFYVTSSFSSLIIIVFQGWERDSSGGRRQGQGRRGRAARGRRRDLLLHSCHSVHAHPVVRRHRRRGVFRQLQLQRLGRGEGAGEPQLHRAPRHPQPVSQDSAGRRVPVWANQFPGTVGLVHSCQGADRAGQRRLLRSSNQGIIICLAGPLLF